MASAVTKPSSTSTPRKSYKRHDIITSRDVYLHKEWKGKPTFTVKRYPHLTKMIFIGCGASTAHNIASMTFNRKTTYDIIVYEPKETRKFFFPGNFFDLFKQKEEKKGGMSGFSEKIEKIIASSGDYPETLAPYNVERNLSEVIHPKGYNDTVWEKSSIVEIDPDERIIFDDKGFGEPYDFLVIGSGSHCYFDEINGLEESLSNNGIHSLYDDTPESFDKLKYDIDNFKGGRVLLYTPAGKIKHSGTNASLGNLMHQHFTEKGLSFSIEHLSPAFYSTGDVFVDGKLRSHWNEIGLKATENRTLVEVRADTKEAVFENSKKEQFIEKFDLLHVIPPMAAIPAVRDNKKLSDAQGWLNVTPGNLTHTTYYNIFGAGSTNNVKANKSYYTSILQSYWLGKTLYGATNNMISRRVGMGVRNDLMISWCKSPQYGEDGLEIVHFAKDTQAIVGHQNGIPLRHQHFPFVWSYDSQRKPLFSRRKELLSHERFWNHINNLCTTPYTNERVFETLNFDMNPIPEAEILEEWNQL